MDEIQSVRSLEDGEPPTPCALWPVDLKLTHVDCDQVILNFQGQYATICELDYNILQVELQNAPKAAACAVVGESCLVEDVLSRRWYRGRVQNRSRGLVDVFLLDHGNVLTVEPSRLFALSNDLLMLPPKIVCGFVANVLPVQERWVANARQYFSSLIGSHIRGYIHGVLPNKVLILEVPEVTKELLQLSVARHVDTDSFLLLVEILSEKTIQRSCESVPDLLLEKQVVQEISFKSSSLRDFENLLLLGSSRLAVGKRKQVRISAAVKPGLFYCQLTSAAKELRAMSDKLAQVCESESSRRNLSDNLGLLCAVKGKDEQWHRGLVQCLPINSQIRIVFVDYGYCDSVKVENVFQLPPNFLLTPILTFPCSLSCLNENDEAKKRQQMLLLRDGLLGEELEVTVEGLRSKENVYLVTLSSGRLAEDDRISSGGGTGDDGASYYQKKYTNATTEEEILKSFFPLSDLQEGSVFEGYVEHVQSPTDFWMRTAHSNDRFEAMMAKLGEHFGRSQLHEDDLLDLEPGVLCCAMYEDDLNYYRALVVDLLEHGAEVFFIDFGNTEKVPSMLIKRLPKEFAVEPGFAFSCTLAHVAPFEDVWTASATRFFRRATNNKTLLAHVICRRGGTLFVDLCEQGAERSESVASLMSHENLAYCWKVVVPAAPLTKEKKADKFEQEESVGLKVTKQTDDTQKPIGRNNDVAMMFKQQNFQPGAEVRVRCSHVVTPSDFWCQVQKHQGDLNKLMEKLQTFCERHASMLDVDAVCCAVRLQQDNKWYRGHVLGVKDSKAEVILIDYGVTVHEKLRNMRALAAEFLKLDGQAFRCSLYNVIRPAGERGWSKEACALFKEYAAGCYFTCKIISQFIVMNGGLYNVADLYTPVQRASSYLMEKGMAVRVQSPKRLLLSASPCSFVYSSFGISVGSEELVHCTHIDSLWEIYLQLDRNTEIIEEIMERTDNVSKELLSKTCPAQTGAICLAKYFGDCKWYRSSVRPTQSSLYCSVFFVDYGNRQVTEKRNVLSIPAEEVGLLFTPIQALRCRLSGVHEEDHLPKVNTWLENNVLNKELKAKFVATDDFGHFMCDLFDGDVHVNEKVKELFAIQKKSSECSKDVKTRSHVFELQASNKVEHRNSKPVPHRSKVFSRKRKKIQNMKLIIKVQEQTVSTWAQPHTRLPKLSDLPNAKIAPGVKTVAFISHCDSAESFFIQLERDDQSILKLREDLNSGSFAQSKTGITSEMEAGDLVAAEYDEDQALYRAVVLSPVSGVLTVEFVDYGNTASVDKKKLYLLPSRFLFEARFSLRCSLSKPHPQQDGDFFIKQAQGKALMVEFLQNLGCAWEVNVEVLGPEAASGEDLCGQEHEKLQEENMADMKMFGIKSSVCEMVEKDADEQPERKVRSSYPMEIVRKPLSQPRTTSEASACCTFPENGMDQIQRMSYAPVELDRWCEGGAAAVATPEDFSITLHDLFLTMIDVSNIMADLMQHFPALPEPRLVRGAACLALYDHKTKLCRAEIMDCNATSVLLNLVDYGHRAIVPRPDLYKLRELPVELASLPKLTYPCRLRGIKPLAGPLWSDKAVVFFQYLMCTRAFQVCFRQMVSEERWEVDVLRQGRSVAEDLVNARHAALVDAALGSSSWQRSRSEQVDDDSEWHLAREDLEEDSGEDVSPDSVREAETEEPRTESPDRPGSLQEPCDDPLVELQQYLLQKGQVVQTLNGAMDWHHVQDEDLGEDSGEDVSPDSVKEAETEELRTESPDRPGSLQEPCDDPLVELQQCLLM